MICNLCERKCGVDRSIRKGFCNASDKIKIARSSLHYWEEPCISGKKGSGTVFFSHCNLKCIFCQNYLISTENNGFFVSTEELSDIFLSLEDKGANNINLVTPTHYVPQIIEAIEISRRHGLSLPIVYNTGSYETVETIKMLNGYIDIYMPDLKYFNDKYAVEYSNAPSYFDTASSAIKEMFKQTGKFIIDDRGIMTKGIIVRHLMLPSLLFDTKKVVDYLYKTYQDNIYISLMSQYTPLAHVKNHPKLSKKLNPKHYAAMIDYCLDKGMKNVFIQDGESAKESFIPEFYTSL